MQILCFNDIAKFYVKVREESFELAVRFQVRSREISREEEGRGDAIVYIARANKFFILLG